MGVREKNSFADASGKCELIANLIITGSKPTEETPPI